MRILVVIMLFCVYEAFVQAHHCGKPTETETHYTLNESKLFKEFVEKVYAPAASPKQNITDLSIRYDGVNYHLKYIIGDHEVANTFRPNEMFNENTWFGPISTTVTVIEVRQLKFVSTIPNGKEFIRYYTFDPNGLIIKGNSTSDVDCTFELIFNRLKHE